MIKIYFQGEMEYVCESYFMNIQYALRQKLIISNVYWLVECNFMCDITFTGNIN